MKNKGLSLIELTIVIAISTIIGLAITFNFLTAHYLSNMTQDNIALSREARIAMNHMTRVLRFAEPTTITVTANQITATIDGGHFRDEDGNLTIIPVDTDIVYERIPADHTLEYTQGTEAAVVMAGGGERDINIQLFNGDWDGTELEIQLTVEKGGRRVSLLTKIRPLGD